MENFVRTNSAYSPVKFLREVRPGIKFLLYFHVSIESLKSQIEETRQEISRILKSMDDCTRNHSLRVAIGAVEFGKIILKNDNINENVNLADLKIAALLHDIGKIHFEIRKLIFKTTPLSTDEFTTLKAHSDAGAKFTEIFGFSAQIAETVRATHENYDGSGYPNGLQGKKIPFMARIIRIIDSLDAMTTVRGYNKPKNCEEAIEELFKHRGTCFDPKLVDIFFEKVDK